MVSTLSRRRLLRLAAASTATAGLVGLVAGCANDSRRITDVGGPPAAGGAAGVPPEPLAAALVARDPGPAAVPVENARAGTPGWELELGALGDAQAYLGSLSVAPGDSLRVFVASRLPHASIAVLRLGWYGGLGAREVAHFDGVSLVSPPPVEADPVSGAARAAWLPAVELTVPDTWVTGAYLVRVEPSGGEPTFAPFIVRERIPTAPILVVSATLTSHAYNDWGGRSLYGAANAAEEQTADRGRATSVSLDRPYADRRGGGDLLRWEYPFVRWLERQAPGYDVAYCADADLELDPETLAGRRLIVFPGHAEYWTVAMRRNVEAARAAGTNLAFFGANMCYWRARLEPGASGPSRTLVCYRRAWLDPSASVNPEATTVRWRDAPAADPESRLIGAMYGHVVIRSADLVCTAPDHWLYDGTGMAAGDAIPRMVGREYDRVWPEVELQPAGAQVHVVATSPVEPRYQDGYPEPDDPVVPVANTTIYTASSGATVFAAGTLQWAWGLDDWGTGYERPYGERPLADARVMRMTANVLDRLGA